jgi:glycogen(starch) synthase
MFTAGRNEFKNKGIDLFIDSLASLRDLLDNENFMKQHPEMMKKTVVAFIIPPQANNGFNQHSLQVSNLLKEMQLYMDRLTINLQSKLLKMVCTSGDFLEIPIKQLLDQQDQITMKRFQ